MAQCVRRRQDDDRTARPPDPPLRHRRDRQRQLALQKPRRRSRSPRSPRLRNPGQLRRGERYRQNPPLKGVKIGRRYGVKFERRLTAVSVPGCATPSASSSMTQNNAHEDRATTAGTDMQEQIRYAWGKSSLGEFIAAVSDVGLLAFEFGENRAAMLSALESRWG